MNDLLRQELRSGWLGIERPYQPLDLLGAALGSYFIYNGVTGRGPEWLTITLGAIMVWIHTRRFLFAPSDREGLDRLLKSLNVTPEELVGYVPHVHTADCPEGYPVPPGRCIR